VKLIYLDTSFLSQFSELESGKLRKAGDTRIWEDLLALLRHGVKKGALLCPASQFQTQEALLAPNLLDGFKKLQLELSKGLFFKHWEDILVHQAANHLLIYMKRERDIKLGWRAFHEQIPPIIEPEATLRSKLEIAEFARKKEREDSAHRSFTEQYIAERNNLLRQTFLLPIYVIKGLPVYNKPSGSLDEIFFKSLLARVMVEADIPLDLDQIEETISFFNTDLVDRIPFIRIHSSLYASVRLTRKYRKGDWLDIAPMACVIPYCSIVTTDGDMKRRIQDLLNFFSREYIVDIYTPSPNDLPAFIQNLKQYYEQ
jgi:hypothetical protein